MITEDILAWLNCMNVINICLARTLPLMEVRTKKIFSKEQY